MAEILEDREAPALVGARLKTFNFNVIAAADDYRLCTMAVYLGSSGAGASMYTGVVSPEWSNEKYTRGDVPRGKVALTLTTTFEVLNREPVAWEREYLYANYGMAQWSVAATLLGINCLPAKLQDTLITACWHYTPIGEWPVKYKPQLVALRRCPYVAGAGHDRPYGYDMRKLFSCTLKTKGEADWVAEKHNMTDNISVHYLLTPDGKLSRRKWELAVERVAHILAGEVVAQLAASTRMVTMDEWWASRWAWAPGGSTTNKAVLKEAIAKDDRLSTKARAGKKTAFEALSDDYVVEQLLQLPAEVARGSTKSEAGGKQRALWASCDETFVVAAYASLHMEKFMNMWGMIGKQTPVDIADWVVASNTPVSDRARWLSLDYSDYNKGHEVRDMVVINYALAAAFTHHGHGAPWARERAACARWVGNALLNRYAHTKEGTYRVFGGLFSGSRDTARDNTLLHAVYARMAEEQCADIYEGFRVGYRAYSGDDEDVEFANTAAALLYYVVHRMNGHDLGVAKQMAGRTHEFLQRIAVPGEHTRRPLFSMLATFASGNWNQDQSIWYGSSIAAVNDNCMELHARGMPLVYARRLAARTLKAIMRVPVHDAQGGMTWYRLEWWAMRNGSVNQEHPLWHGLGVDTMEPPQLAGKPTPVRGMATHATDAWVRKVQRLLPLLPRGKVAEYRAALAAESYGRLYTEVRQRDQQRGVLATWPERVSEVPYSRFAEGALQPLEFTAVLRVLCAYPGVRRPATSDEIAARMGLDARAISMVGGWEAALRQLPASYVGMWEQPSESVLTDYRWHMCDPAIVNWATHSVAAQRSILARPDAYLGVDLVTTKRQNSDGTAIALVVTLAPNGAGKTTYAENQARKGHKVLDGDSLLLDAPSIRTALRHIKHATSWADPERVARFIVQEVVRRGVRELVWQVDVSTMIPYWMRMGVSVSLRVCEPPAAVINARLAARWWTEGKIRMRQQLFARAAKSSTMAAYTNGVAVIETKAL